MSLSEDKAAVKPVFTATEIIGLEPGNIDEFVGILHKAYLTNVKPLEDMFMYDLFHSSWFEESILNQRPFITFFGPWSSGKSTFINYLLQGDYLWTGPQPTTADFTVIMYGEEAGPINGRVLANAKNLPFKGLSEFGESFIERLQGFQVPHELLKRVTLIDTPGVLENAKDIRERQFDYIKVSRWFAERSDLIFVLFDPTKLDAGVELRMMFKHAFSGMAGKIRMILNKADSINTQELMRVYGSLFWNLSNLINCTEPPRVYVSSFWNKPYREGTFTLLFTEEKTDLLHEIMEIVPQQARDKKVSSLIRRAKAVLAHVLIIGGMRSELPLLFGKEKAKRKALDNLQKTYEIMASKYKMNWRDFPPVEEYRAFLEKFDLEKFPDIDKAEKEGHITRIRNCIDTVLPSMLRSVKNVKAADPRNKAEREKLRQMYHETIISQHAGEAEKRGGGDVSQLSICNGAIAAPQTACDAMVNATGNVMINEQMLLAANIMQMLQQQQYNQQNTGVRSDIVEEVGNTTE